MRGMSAWSTATRRTIEEPFFSETIIKEDTSLKPNPNPGTALAEYDSCDMGESPLACLPSTTANRINQTLLEEARARAKDNMTPAEWLTILKPATKNGIPLLPLDYTSL